MKIAILSQYKASLKMLLNVIAKCPDRLWENRSYENAYWRIVYHTLFLPRYIYQKTKANSWAGISIF